MFGRLCAHNLPRSVPGPFDDRCNIDGVIHEN